MSKENFPIGSQWKNRSGGRAMIVNHDGEDLIVFHYDGNDVQRHTANGCKYYHGTVTDFDIMEPWVEPRAGELYLIVDDVGTKFVFTAADSNEMAVELKTDSTVAIVGPIKWTEGQGL